MSALTTVLCPECSNCISETYGFYEKAKIGYFKQKIQGHKEHKTYDPSRLDLDPDTTPKVGFILNTLDLNLMCCRMHTLAAKNINLLE